MKKLHHDLYLEISGPSGTDVSNCVNQAAMAALIAGIVAGAATSGSGGAQAAFNAGAQFLIVCVGASCQVNLRDSSSWIEWWT